MLRHWLSQLPGRLSFKIFVLFWVAMTVAGFVLLGLEAERAQRLNERARAMTGAAIAFYAVSAAKDHEDEQTWEARAFLNDLYTRTRLRAWLFDEGGHEVSGYAPQALRASNVALRKVREQALASDTTEFEPRGGVTLAAHATRGPSGRRYVLAGELPAARFGPWQAAPGVQALRLLAVLATAGAVSWILAHHLSTPIKTLRDATRQLAQGDLSARAATRPRRDELGELGRDFNRMAERLEASTREQERLVAAQKRLLGDVAHELRSPLARAAIALELARDALAQLEEGESIRDEARDEASGAELEHLASLAPPSAEVAESLDRIERETGRLAELINRLLTLSRLESGVEQPEQVLVDLAAQVRGVCADANYEVRPSRSVQFEARCEGALVRGTPDLLRSAIENLVRNAARHTPPSTCVQVALHCERGPEDARRWDAHGHAPDDSQEPGEAEAPSTFVSPLVPGRWLPLSWAVVSVRDHGPGVPEAEMREVFRPFYRAGKGRATREGGVGLGLAIALRAVELHGGQVRAGNAPGGGLLVEVRLPCEESSA